MEMIRKRAGPGQRLHTGLPLSGGHEHEPKASPDSLPGYERVDAITWTYHQSHSYAYSVWLLLARPFNTVEVEFLPVYKPSQEEKDSAELYAKN
ncbi:Uncharacterized protein FKW44_019058, partial [Caligus rogercresseyi]